MAFSITMLWTHPYQACLSSMDEVAKKLTLLVNSSDNWAYTFVWFNKDAQHVLLPKEDHFSDTVNGLPSRNVCGPLCQLEVPQLLQCRDHVVYLEGWNGGLEPVLTSLSGALVQGGNMLGEPACEPSFISVDLSWFTLGDDSPEVSAHCTTSTPTPPSHLTIECPPKADSHISMITEVRELLSCAELDTSRQVLGDSLLKGPTSPALGVSSPPGRKASPSQ